MIEQAVRQLEFMELKVMFNSCRNDKKVGKFHSKLDNKFRHKIFCLMNKVNKRMTGS